MRVDKSPDMAHKKIIKFWLANVFLRLVSRENEPDNLKNYLRFSNPIESIRGKRKAKNIAKELFKLVFLMFTIYHVIKNLFCLVIHFRRDLLLVNWRPLARFNSSSCNSFTNLIFSHDEDRIKYEKVNYLNYLLYNIGDSFSILTRGLPIHSCATHLVIILCYFHYGIYTCWNKDIRVDLLSFIMNPQGERSKIQREIELIFDDLLGSLKYTITCSSLRFDHNQKVEMLYLKSQRRNSMYSYPVDSEIKQMYLRTNKKMLLKLKAAKLVEPANRTDFWHQQIGKNFGLLLVVTFVSNEIISNLTSFFYIFTELTLRVRQRLLEFNCTQSGIYNLQEFFYFSMEKLNPEQSSIYESYSKNEVAYSDLLWTELEIYLNFKIVKSIALHQLAIYIEPICASLYLTLYTCSFLDRVVWLNQIQAQIQACTEELKYSKVKNKYQNDKDMHETKDNRLMFQNIAIAYVNLELFRRSQTKFKKLASLLIFQGTMLSSVTLVVVHLVGTKLELNNKGISLMLASYVVLIANLYLFFGAMLTSKFEKIRKSILELLASCKHNLLQYNFMIDLWSRQITSPSETLELFSPGIFGMHLTWGRILTINVYLVGLYIIVR